MADLVSALFNPQWMWQDKGAIISGGSGSIGLAVAQRLASEGSLPLTNPSPR